MRKFAFWLLLSASLQLVGLAAPAAADPPPMASQQWPGNLPGDWRALGDDELTPLDPAPRNFNVGRDGRVLHSPEAGPGGFEPPAQGAARPADPAKDAAAAKAAKRKPREDELKKAMAPRPEPAAVRQHALEELFRHLIAASDPQEARGFAEAIQHVWIQSPSETANLIMQRAMFATAKKDLTLAGNLLDRLVALEPNWAEAWNQRATVRFLGGDFDGSMADIDKVIRLEPRHFGALTGMGVILQRAGFDKRALDVFRKALEIYPAQPELKETVEKLDLELNGRDI